MEPLRSPPRKVLPAARQQFGLLALAIGLAVGFAGLIWYVRDANDSKVATPLSAPTATAIAAPDTVYIYRCADGTVQSEPCQDAPASGPKHELPSLMVYDAPRYRDDPTTRAMVVEGDADYRRQVEAAHRAPCEYEKAVAMTSSDECRALRNEKEAINARMRERYGNAEGEWFRDRLCVLGCWTGTPAPR